MANRSVSRAGKAQTRSALFTDKAGKPIEGAPAPRPCPFCGHADVAVEVAEGGHAAYVECEHCGAQAAYAGDDEGVPRTLAECILEAARRWNRRRTTADAPAIPVSLFEDRENGMHVRIMSAAGIVGTVRNALDDEHGEEQAALEVAVKMIHGIDDELDSASWEATEAFCAANPDHPLALERQRIKDGMQRAHEEWQAGEEARQP